jgi:hypothetical protein
MLEESNSNQGLILSLLIIAFILDVGIIFVAVIFRFLILLLIFAVVAFAAAKWLLDFWNVDERTENAYKHASQLTISIYFYTTLSIGTLLMIFSYYNNFIYWEVAGAIILCSFLILYIQAILSVLYENKIR